MPKPTTVTHSKPGKPHALRLLCHLVRYQLLQRQCREKLGAKLEAKKRPGWEKGPITSTSSSVSRCAGLEFSRPSFWNLFLISLVILSPGVLVCKVRIIREEQRLDEIGSMNICLIVAT